jgi:hypothetical protein
MSVSSASSITPGPALPVASTPSRAPDPEVAAATARDAPMHPDTDHSTFERVVDIARRALEDLTPVVVVNRRADTALAMFDGDAASPVDTIHTAAPPGLVGSARRVGRRVSEQLHDTFGTGENQGRTVFGSTRFVGTSDAMRGARAVLDSLVRQGEVGVGAYGPVALLVRPASLPGRTTFAARDTALGITRVADEHHLPQIVAERLARGVPGAPTPNELAGGPIAEGVRKLRAWLTGDGLARRDGYIEAQLRGLTLGDFEGVHVSHAYDGPVMKKIDPGPLPDADATARLRSRAERLGMAFSDAAPS